MPTLIVTDDAKDWPSELPEAEVVDAWSYLTSPRFAAIRNVKLFNLCKSYRYQSTAIMSRCSRRHAATAPCPPSPRSRI